LLKNLLLAKENFFRCWSNIIIYNVSLTSNKTQKTASISMTKFLILKAFKINIHSPNASVVKDVLLIPPSLH